jgi:hypothetical protein
MEEESHTILWRDDLEQYFASVGEKCLCSAWLHKRSEQHYTRKAIFIDLPVIVCGTVNGAISVGSNSLFGQDSSAPVYVGVVALGTAILSTIGSYFGFSRRAESHRMSALAYEKLYNYLTVELSLPRVERMRASDLLKHIRNEYNRLLETSPLVPADIIKLFKERFSAPEYAEVSKPSEANGLHPIHIYREPTPTSPRPKEEDEKVEIRLSVRP